MVLNLLATAKAGNCHASFTAGAHGGEESLLTDGAGYVVVFHLVAERAGHPAASTVDLGGGVAPHVMQQRDGVRRADQCFLVTMGVI